MRIDRRAGAISSPSADVFDFDRVCLAGVSRSPLRLNFSSSSESEYTALEADIALGVLLGLLTPLVLELFSSALEPSIATLRRLLGFNARPRLITGYMIEKCPSSS